MVSELAKGSSTRKTKRVRVANAVLAGVLAVGVMAAMPSEAFAEQSAVVAGQKTNETVTEHKTSVQRKANTVETDTTKSANAVVVGGHSNNVKEYNSAVIGGNNNAANRDNSAVLGGNNNTADKVNSAVIAGESNYTSGTDSIVLGGSGNATNGNSNNAVVGGKNNIAVSNSSAVFAGNKNVTNGSYSAIIGGQNNYTTNVNAIVIGGKNNYATQSNAVVLGGKNNYANGDASVAFGNGSQAGGNNSIAGLGGLTGEVTGTTTYDTYTYDSTTKRFTKGTVTVNTYTGGANAIALGTGSWAKQDDTIALGTKAQSTGEKTVAIGNSANASQSNTVALGNSASATVADGIALGSNSQASTTKGQVGYVPTTGIISNTSTSVWTSQLGAVSVGTSEKTRQIINVAAGTKDTDAVNVAQLKAAQVQVVSGSDNVVVTPNKSENGTTYTITVTGGTEKYTAGDHITISDDNVISATDTNTQNTVSAGDNITVTSSDNSDGTKNFEVAMKDNISVTSVIVGGSTIINSSGVTIENGPSITTSGINAGGKKITNVANGTEDSDAVNYGQLKQVQQATQDVALDLSKLSNRVDKGIAGAAALAALHPMDFDPDDKLTFAAGLGNYKGENAGAVGMFFRPDEKVMLSLGATVGNSENIVNAGVSFSLDRTARNTNNKAAMAREILDMRAQMNQMASANAALVQQVNEMAAIINELKGNNALKPLAAENVVAGQEEARIRVEHIDTVDGYKLDEAHQIDRVHVLGDTKDENGNVIVKRDHYGNVVSQESK